MKRIVVGISGASGMLYAARFLRAVPADYEVHLIVSSVAQKILQVELGWDVNKQRFSRFWETFSDEPYLGAAIVAHPAENHFAPVASGSFITRGMVIIPCSAKTLSAVASGYAANLMERTADVHLKERRPLILVLRETPYSLIHIENMKKATLAGATILPASPGFYHHPQSVNDLVDFVAARVMDHLNIEHQLSKRWGENDG
ncbi:UbiX family flavin prenyltransferase [Calditrichota bacterium LG25]